MVITHKSERRKKANQGCGALAPALSALHPTPHTLHPSPIHRPSRQTDRETEIDARGWGVRGRADSGLCGGGSGVGGGGGEA
eukprot:3155496-Rhodomonas_salina.4